MEIKLKISALLGFKSWQNEVTSQNAIKFVAFGIMNSAFLNHHITILNSHMKPFNRNETKYLIFQIWKWSKNKQVCTDLTECKTDSRRIVIKCSDYGQIFLTCVFTHFWSMLHIHKRMYVQYARCLGVHYVRIVEVLSTWNWANVREIAPQSWPLFSTFLPMGNASFYPHQ
jgi:hypothetical protein